MYSINFIIIEDIYYSWKIFISNNCTTDVLPENFEIKGTFYWAAEHSYRILPKRLFFPIKNVYLSLLKLFFIAFKKQNMMV